MIAIMVIDISAQDIHDHVAMNLLTGSSSFTVTPQPVVKVGIAIHAAIHFMGA